LDGFLRRQQVLGAIEMRTEAHARVGNFAQLGKAEDLIAAGIGENGARPGHEVVESTELAHQLVPGPQIKMISVGQEEFGAEFFEHLVAQSLDRCLRPHRHEKRRLHRATRRVQYAASRPRRILYADGEGKTHRLSVSGEYEGPSNPAEDE